MMTLMATGTIEPGVARAIDLGHAPGTEQTEHFVRSDSLADRYRISGEIPLVA